MRDQPKTKLFFVTTSMVFGGAEIMLLELIRGIDQTKFDVTICVLKADQGLQIRFEALGYKVHVFPVGLSWYGLKSFGALLSFFFKVRPQIVQSWMYRADFYCCFLKFIRPKTKLIWSIHNCDLSLSRNGLSRWLLVKACSVLSWFFPDTVVYCAASAIDTHKSFGFRSTNTLFIPNGFDISRFQKLQDARLGVCDEFALDPGVPIIGCFGRFDPQKNHYGLLEVIGLLHNRGVKVQLLLAGGGVDHANEQLQTKAQNMKVSQYVKLLGVRQDMPRLMSALDLYLSFSSGEAFPLVLGEAMLCGTPVIATNCGDSHRFALEPWMLIPVGDVNAAADAVEYLLRQTDAYRKALSVKSRELVLEHYSVDKNVAAYSDLYRSIVR